MLRPLAAGLLALNLAPALGACPSDDAIERLLADREARRPTQAVAVGAAMDDALCAQDKLVARLQQTLGPPVGYKAGLTSEAVQQRFRTDAPVRGVLLEGMLLEDGAEVPADFGARPLFEADLLLEVADEAINDATTPEQVLAHLRSIMPFIELPDLVVAEGQPLDGAVITAINVGARLGVKGQPLPVSDHPGLLDALAAMTVVLEDDQGRQLASAPGRAVLGHPLNSVLWLVGDGVHLKAGDLISVGSIGPLLQPQPGRRVTATYRGLPHNPRVSVRFR